MAYVQEICIAGKVIEVRKFNDWGHGRRHRGPRAAKKKRSSEKQKNANEVKAERDLTRILNAGLRGGDYYLTMTYNEDEPRQDEAKKEIKNCINRWKNLYKKHGFDLMWLAVTEYEDKRIHHHIVMNAGPDILAVMGKWKRGFVKARIVDDSGQYCKLAHYLIKATRKTFAKEESLNKKRWSRSRGNWPKPIITKTVIKRERWAKEPRPRKGYIIEKKKTVQGYDDLGYPYQFYSMVRLK